MAYRRGAYAGQTRSIRRIDMEYLAYKGRVSALQTTSRWRIDVEHTPARPGVFGV
jgi:hypothetical protein